MRLDLFDGFRGHLLVGMLIAHFSFHAPLRPVGLLHHFQLVGMYDAEFFILIAGFLIGFLWTQGARGPQARARFTLRRLITIYKYYLLSAAPFVAYRLSQGAAPLEALLGVLAMTEGGFYSDILPIYFICFLLMAPFAVSARLYRPRWMLGFSTLLYLASLASTSGGLFGYGGALITFDVGAWQLVFFAALVAGARSEALLAWIRALSPLQSSLLFLGMLAAVIVLRLTPWYPDPLGTMVSESGLAHRRQLHPLFLLRIMLVAGLVALALLRPVGPLASIGAALRWYFSLAVLRSVGRRSIQMFTFHVYIMACYRMLIYDLPVDQQMIFAALSLLLFIAAPNLIDLARRPARN